MWPKFEDQKVGERLAMIGSIKDEILHADELALAVIRILQKEYPQMLYGRYQIEENEDAYQTLEKICISRKCFQKGEQPDILRASGMVLEDFRSGRIGRITLEHPEEWQ